MTKTTLVFETNSFDELEVFIRKCCDIYGRQPVTHGKIVKGEMKLVSFLEFDNNL